RVRPGFCQILFNLIANCISYSRSGGDQKPGKQWSTVPSELRIKSWTLCGPAPLVVTTAGLSGSCLPDLPAYGSSLMFLNPHTNWLFRVFSRASCESVTALKLWLALQQTPSRSPRACNQKMSLFSFWAFSLASPREESQWICSVSLWTFCSTTWLGILGGAFLPPAAQGT